jgi:hypothetical protein
MLITPPTINTAIAFQSANMNSSIGFILLNQVILMVENFFQRVVYLGSDAFTGGGQNCDSTGSV